jgi:superfamily II DNA/RNA helicase
MGFIEDVETIARATPSTRQTLLFSATLDGKIAQVAKNLLRDPKRIEVAGQRERLENIDQRLHFCDDLAHKNRILDHLLRDAGLNQALIFTATKRDADQLADDLYQQGFPAAALHGDMHQGARNRTLTKLRRGEIRVLVATDVAARGIDVAGISHVINFDLPKQAEDYVHRIGRTGRAGANGTAVSLVSSRDGLQLRRISHFTGHVIEAHVIPGLEPKGRMRAEAPRADRGGKRHAPHEFKPAFKPRSGERTHGNREAAFAGPSERRMQERYAPQADAYRNADGNRATRTSDRPGRKFDK